MKKHAFVRLRLIQDVLFCRVHGIKNYGVLRYSFFYWFCMILKNLKMLIVKS